MNSIFTNEKLPTFPQMDGVFILNKPSGPSSAQCLKIFKKLGQKKTGHGGTLDPLAEGVLIVLLGQATKISSWLLEGGEKTYRGILHLGLETDTWDSLGKVVREFPIAGITQNAVENAIRDWLQFEEQEVPAFSAARHQGRPLYELARRGIDTPKKLKKIKVSKAVLLDMRLPFVSFRTSCSSGSYIRSLAHSLGKRLGCGASLCGLVREYSHPFTLECATSLEELRSRPELLPDRLYSIEAALPGWPVVDIQDKDVGRLKNGMPIFTENGAIKERAILRNAGNAMALAHAGQCNGRPCWLITRGLWN